MRNPYIIDRPLGGEDLFFGRERELVTLQDIWQTDRRLVVVYGKPHIGKTSLLNHLSVRIGSLADMIILDWQDCAGPGTLAQRIARAMTGALEWPGQETGDALADLGACLQIIASDPEARSAYVAIDGLGLRECAADRSWPQAVAALDSVCRGGPVALVLAIEARPEECQSIDISIPSVVLSGLSLGETEDLLLVPARGNLTYDLESMRRIYALTGGEPHLVQLYGHILFEKRAQRGWVGLIETEQAVDEVVEWASPQFSELWERCSIRARIMLCVFAESIGTHGFGTPDDVRRRLQRERVEMPLADVEQGLDELRQRDLVEQLGGGLYRFRNALFLRWLRNNRSLMETVRQSREYKTLPHPSVPPLLNRRIDWVGLGLWVVIGALIIAVGSVWRARETRISWTDAPPTRQVVAAEGEEPVVAESAQADAVYRLAYMGKPEAGQQWDIYLMQGDGLDPVRLTQGAGDNTGPAWSPDGERLAFVSDRVGNREIFVMNADGSDPVNLTENPAEDWTPTWSPDNQQLAFASYRDGNWEIYVMDAGGGNQQRLTQSPSADYAPAWSPAGDTLAFVSDRSGNLDIYLMAPDGSDVRALTTDEGTDQGPAWSPDGRQLLWESYRDRNMEIMAIAIEGGQPRNLTQDVYADDHGGTWSPDGGQIAYFSNRDGGWDIFTLDLRTGTRTNITQSVDMEQYPAYQPLTLAQPSESHQ